jgi:hypothetical protein
MMPKPYDCTFDVEHCVDRLEDGIQGFDYHRDTILAALHEMMEMYSTPEWPKGSACCDWKDHADTILKQVGDQLRKFGLQVVMFDTGGDFYAWNIQKTKRGRTAL